MQAYHVRDAAKLGLVLDFATRYGCCVLMSRFFGTDVVKAVITTLQ